MLIKYLEIALNSCAIMRKILKIHRNYVFKFKIKTGNRPEDPIVELAIRYFEAISILYNPYIDRDCLLQRERNKTNQTFHHCIIKINFHHLKKQLKNVPFNNAGENLRS